MSIHSGVAAFVGLALAFLADQALADCKVSQIAELPVTMNGPRPMIPAKINGADVMFLADSGAFYSVLSPSTAAEHKLAHHVVWNLTIGGIGGHTQASVTTVKAFTLAAFPLPNVEFLIAEGVGGDDAAGVLGQNILGVADVEYDLAHGVIRLIRAEGCRQVPLAYWARDMAWSAIDIKPPEPVNRHTEGVAFVNGVQMRVGFNTGAATSMLTLRAAARAGVKLDGPGVVPGGLTSGVGPRPVKTWIAPIASFKIGDEEIRNTRLRIGDTDLEGVDMLLGPDFFLSHRVYVSNAQHKLYFTYNGGPVFNLTAKTPPLVQNGSDQAPQPSTITNGAVPEPTGAEGFSRRGAAFAARRDFQHAIADFDRAIAMTPSEPKYFYQRAMARWSDKQPLPAAADLDQALKLKPDDIEALTARARMRLAKGETIAAIADLDAVSKAAPKEADIRLALAELYEHAEQFDPALAQIELWVAAHADDGQMFRALNDRCWVRALLGRDLDQALNDCNRALGDAPKTAAVLDSRGLVHLRLGQFNDAVADYDAALALRPGAPWSLYGRGLAKMRLGVRADGQADVAAAVALQPKLPDQAKHYGIVAPD